jgi:DNA repair exonuclease SbcCD ATPase subunit
VLCQQNSKTVSFVYHRKSAALYFMATASNTSGDKKCDTCKPKKTVGITSCCGCHRCFCGKHFIEHRDQLSENLNTVVNQHDEILQDLKIRIDHSSKGQAGNDDARNLFQKINEWENRTINACCDVADKARASVKQLFDKTKENNSFTKRLSSLANELEEQQESVSFVERDLDRWRKKLDELKNDINRPIEFPTNVIITTQDIDWEESIKISQLPSSNKIIKHYVIVFGEKGVGL